MNESKYRLNVLFGDLVSIRPNCHNIHIQKLWKNPDVKFHHVGYKIYDTERDIKFCVRRYEYYMDYTSVTNYETLQNDGYKCKNVKEVHTYLNRAHTHREYFNYICYILDSNVFKSTSKMLV